MSFVTDITNQVKQKSSHICVGLDSDYEKLPSIIKNNQSITDALFEFNKKIIDATQEATSCYKLNMVFYAGYGLEGLTALKKTNEYIKTNFSTIKIIADAKRSEMKRTAELAAKEIFDEFLFDAVTVTPWFGFDTIEPYQKYTDKAVFVLCHDSNPSAGDIQDAELKDGSYLYEKVTDLVVNKWNASGNILVEGPLTYPTILRRIKEMTPKEQFFLVAGLGAQGGNIEDLNIFKKDKNFVVNASRSIIFASSENDFDTKAREVLLEYNKKIGEILS